MEGGWYPGWPITGGRDFTAPAKDSPIEYQVIVPNRAGGTSPANMPTLDETMLNHAEHAAKLSDSGTGGWVASAHNL
jgi:hypothetical protein